MKLKKLLALVMTAVICCMCFASCGGTASDIDYITKNGKMVIGITDYAPMNYKDSNKEWTGFDTEFAQAICEKLGVEAEFVEINWDNKFPELEAKSIDCIWNGMTITDEVTSNADVSTPYVRNKQVIVMNKANAEKYKNVTVDDVSALTSLKFVAESGSAGESAIKDKGLDKNYTELGTQTDALLEVKSGSADACVIDVTMADSMTGEGTSYSDLTSTIALTDEEYGIAFRKGSDLTEKVNGYITELVNDGSLKKLADKYELDLIAK